MILNKHYSMSLSLDTFKIDPDMPRGGVVCFRLELTVLKTRRRWYRNITQTQIPALESLHSCNFRISSLPGAKIRVIQFFLPIVLKEGAP